MRVWLLAALFLLADTADRFFCPTVETMSAMLGLSPSTAGVTLLALGNGAPDVFSSLAAIVGGNPKVGLGAVVSAGAFVTCFVVGCVAVAAAPFPVRPRPFLRDSCLFATGVLLLLLIYLSGHVYLWQAAGLVAFYICFVVVAIVSNAWEPPDPPHPHAHGHAHSPREDKKSTAITHDSPVTRYKSHLVQQPGDDTCDEPQHQLQHVQQQPQQQQPLLPLFWSSSPLAHHHHGIRKPPQHVLVHVPRLWRLALWTLTTWLEKPQISTVLPPPPPLSFLFLSIKPLAFSLYPLLPLFCHTPSSSPFLSPSFTQMYLHLPPPPPSPPPYSSLPVTLPLQLRTCLHVFFDPLRLATIPSIDPSAWHPIRHRQRRPLPSHCPLPLFPPPPLPSPQLRACLHVIFDPLRLATIPSIDPSAWDIRYATANVALCPLIAIHTTRALLPPDSNLLFFLPPLDPPSSFSSTTLSSSDSSSASPTSSLFSSSSTLSTSSLAVRSFVLIQSSLCAAAYLLATRASSPIGAPRSLIVPVSFAMSVFWIALTASELLGLLSALGIILHVSPSILGITVLAWGNSVGDLVADVTIAKAGHPTMAIAGCFAGPMFNLMVGVGSALAVRSWDLYPEPLVLFHHPNVLLALCFLLGGVLSSIAFIVWSGFRVTRSWGVCLICMYLTFVVAAVAIESSLH
ncbi:unnamed protein product [Closterium sp. NIES-53]